MTEQRVVRLTAKEKRFSVAIAGGASLASAYAQVYSDRASGRVAEANARQIMKRERVAAEVQRLRRCPPADNFTAIQDYAIAKLIDAAESDDPALRHQALKTLLQHWARGLKQSPPSRPTVSVPHQKVAAPEQKVDRAKLISELRELYRKGLGTEPPDSAQTKPDPPWNDVPSGRRVTPEESGSDFAESALESSAIPAHERVSGEGCTRIADHWGSEETSPSDAPEEQRAEAEKYEWVNLPGHFGKPNRKRVRIR